MTFPSWETGYILDLAYSVGFCVCQSTATLSAGFQTILIHINIYILQVFLYCFFFTLGIYCKFIYWKWWICKRSIVVCWRKQHRWIIWQLCVYWLIIKHSSNNKTILNVRFCTMLAKQFYLYIENVRGVVLKWQNSFKFNGRYSGKNNSIPSTNIFKQ